MADVAGRLRERPQRTEPVTLAADPADADELAKLRAAVFALEWRVQQAGADEATLQALADARADLRFHEERMVTITFTMGAARVDTLDGGQERTFHGPAAVEWLIQQHPPTEADLALHARRVAGWKPSSPGEQPPVLLYSPAEFQPRLIAACCRAAVYSDGTSDGLPTADEWAALVADGRFADEDLDALFAAASRVNQRGSRVGDLGKG